MTHEINDRLARLHPSGIRHFTALARSTPDCASLTIGEPDFDTPYPIKEACHKALLDGRTHYPQNAGDPDLRQAIARFESEKKGLDYAPDEIIVTAGATQAIFTAMMGLLNPGDEVIILLPAFGLYEEIARLAGATIRYLDTTLHGFQITKEALAAQVTPRTKLLIVNSPNNPSGVVYHAESLANIRQCMSANDRLYVLWDAVYDQLVYAPLPPLPFGDQLRSRLLVVQSFSKPYAMTGFRVGYLMAEQSLIQQLLLLHAYQIVSIPAPFHAACIAALEVDIRPMVETYQKRRDYMLARLHSFGLHVPVAEGAFYLFPSIAQFGLSSEDFATRLIREGKLAGVPGSCFGTDGFMRFSYCYSEEAIRLGMDRLERFLAGLSRDSMPHVEEVPTWIL